MGRIVIFLVTLVMCLGPARFAVARDCGEALVEDSLSGLLVDARRHVDKDDHLDLAGLPSLSKEDRQNLFLNAHLGPYFALIQDGTNRVFAVYVYYLPDSPPEQTIGQAGEWFAREGVGFLGRHVRATGCVDYDLRWPNIQPFDGLELLE
mgnify:CR=1 FL=1